MKLSFDYQLGDMLKLPYLDNQFDCILAFNVISHTDTQGVRKILEELKRVLKQDGECYLTLCSKDTWGFKQQNWPLVDENTRLRMEKGPEYKVPHFYADYNLIKDLFKDFQIIFIKHIEEFHEHDDKLFNSYHFHILIKKL